MNKKENRITLRLVPGSSFLLGGVSIDPAYNAVTAIDEHHLPYLTATAIKGALRLEFEALVRGVEEEKAGEKEEAKEEEKKGEKLCDLDIDIRGCGTCLACRLFGGGNFEGKLRFNAATLENGETLFPESIRHALLEKGKRQGVAISRILGKAKDKSFFTTRPFPHLGGTREIAFHTAIDIRDNPNEKEKEYLDMFFALISQTGIFMGSRKSTGQGYFKIEAGLPMEYVPPPAVDTAAKELKLYQITLDTLEPLLLGKTKNRYVIDTYPYIPASTIGGTIGFRLSDYGLSVETTKMIDERKSFSTFNLYPDSPYPVPASMRRKKGEDTESKDLLLADYLVQKAIEEGAFNNVAGLYKILYIENNLRPVPLCREPETIYHTKIAIGRKLQKSSDGLLYSMELIPKETTFKGFIIGETWAMETLNDLGELWMGGKRTRGFGRVKINLQPIDITRLVNPGHGVDTRLREIAGKYSLSLPQDRRYFTLDLLSDFALPDNIPKGGRSFEAFLTGTLFPGVGVRVEKSFLELVLRGGYDFRHKQVKPMMERIKAGSTLLLSVPLDRVPEFTGILAGMVADSVKYKWDLTPLFRLDGSDHIDNLWR